MMPLAFGIPGEKYTVKKTGGSPVLRKHLENLGFTPGCPVSIITCLAGNMIVHVRDARVAISEELARKIMI